MPFKKNIPVISYDNVLVGQRVGDITPPIKNDRCGQPRWTQIMKNVVRDALGTEKISMDQDDTQNREAFHIFKEMQQVSMRLLY